MHSQLEIFLQTTIQTFKVAVWELRSLWRKVDNNIWKLIAGKGLNVAVSGAVVADIPGQIDHLMTTLQAKEYDGLLV